jgi:chlorobactene glucosyltransferase
MTFDPERPLVHACALAALGYALRAAGFAATWVEVPLLAAAPGEPLPRLSIVVPARDEERSIERCVRSLLAQDWLDFEVIVVDDGSRDATLAILEALAREDPRLHVVRGEALPPGWVGKPWALVQGERAASGDWLLFTDADSTHASRGAASALWFATRGGFDALSIATNQELGSFWERAALPSILGTILFVAGTFGEINDPQRPDKAVANGQYILVSRRAYDALGGHAALRDEIVEDVAFARRLKADGRFRFVLAAGPGLARVRMYRSGREIWSGFTKNVFFGANGDVRALAGGAILLSLISIAPPLLAMRALATARYAVMVEAMACTVANVATASWGMRRAGFPRRLALLQPLGIACLIAIMANSTFRVLSGRGVEWRGRTYREAASGPKDKS